MSQEAISLKDGTGYEAEVVDSESKKARNLNK